MSGSKLSRVLPNGVRSRRDFSCTAMGPAGAVLTLWFADCTAPDGPSAAGRFGRRWRRAPEPARKERGLLEVERAAAHPLRFRWTAPLLALLGHLPDMKVAARAKVSVNTVSAERRRREIPPFQRRRARIEWTKDMLALLGTDSDNEVAAVLGLQPGSVRVRRLVLGIPAFHSGGPRSQLRWTSRMLGLLGTVSDAKLAKRLGVSRSTVWAKRQALWVASYQPAAERVEWSREQLALLGRRPDVEVARQLGIKVSGVTKKRQERGLVAYRHSRPIVRTAGLKGLLRRLSNRELRERYGLSSSVVWKLRREYGITAPGARPKVWTERMMARLGKETDVTLARELCITASAVLQKRRSLGITRFVRRRPWTAVERRWLGRLTDAEVARRLGLAVLTVTVMRRSLGIPRPSRKRKRRSG